VDHAIVLETTFLVDLDRERSQEREDRCRRLLREHKDHRLFITDTIAGELASGLTLSGRETWESFIAPFRILAHIPDINWKYGVLFRHLSENGLMIGANDLWIAATCLAYDIPVVTRNTAHFKRIPELRVIGY